MIDGKKAAILIICASVLFLISYSVNAPPNFDVYAKISENTSDNSSNQTSSTNLTGIQNATVSNTNSAIPYVLNVTNSSDTTAQVVNQVIQAISGGQSTSLQEVLDSASNGNSSSTSLEQVIDAASSALNNQSANNSAKNTSSNITSDLP